MSQDRLDKKDERYMIYHGDHRIDRFGAWTQRMRRDEPVRVTIDERFPDRDVVVLAAALVVDELPDSDITVEQQDTDA